MILPSWSSQAKCRACWATEAPVGEAVQPARWTQRMAFEDAELVAEG